MPDQYLTLLISGFRGSYPALSSAGQVVSGFAKIRFNVGLSDGKPAREIVEAITRDFGLKEDEAYVPEPEPEVPEYDEDDPDTWELPEKEKEPTPELEPTNEPGRFDKFSLSTSLNSLLNDSLIPLIQLRLKFGIGWAGAEVLFAEQTEKQISSEQAYSHMADEITAADTEERGIAHLPIDTLMDSHQGNGEGSINLPLVAYSYLVRRVLVRSCVFFSSRLTSLPALPSILLGMPSAHSVRLRGYQALCV
jgi:ubiquitin-conjugating enzyme E2 Q